jgi:hypothetical protein
MWQKRAGNITHRLKTDIESSDVQAFAEDGTIFWASTGRERVLIYHASHTPWIVITLVFESLCEMT